MPIFIRPCHNGFAYEFIKKNYNNLSFVIYIGLKQNIQKDLMDLKHGLVSDWTGADGENIYLIKCGRYNKSMNNYLRVFIDYTGNYIGNKNYESSWFRKSEEWLVNSNGGRMTINDCTEILEEVQANSFEALDWSKTYLNNPNKNCGWIAPDGTFYGCDESEHDSCAHFLLKSSVSDLEKKGYVHLYGYDGYFCDRMLTEEQRNTLNRLGINTEKEINLTDIDERPLSWGKYERI